MLHWILPAHLYPLSSILRERAGERPYRVLKEVSFHYLGKHRGRRLGLRAGAIWVGRSGSLIKDHQLTHCAKMATRSQTYSWLCIFYNHWEWEAGCCLLLHYIAIGSSLPCYRVKELLSNQSWLVDINTKYSLSRGGRLCIFVARSATGPSLREELGASSAPSGTLC